MITREKVTFLVALAFSSMKLGFWSRVCDRKKEPHTHTHMHTHTHTRVSHVQPNARASSGMEKMGFCLTRLVTVSFQGLSLLPGDGWITIHFE